MEEPQQKTSTDDERRGAPRHKINLQSSVLISAISDPAPYFVLQGQLQDVSISGLGIIVSFDDMLELKMMGDNLTLHLLLPLPAKAIELDAVPVRYQPLGENPSGEILVGAHITNMNGRDRVLFMDFIHECEEHQNL